MSKTVNTLHHSPSSAMRPAVPRGLAGPSEKQPSAEPQANVRHEPYLELLEGRLQLIAVQLMGLNDRIACSLARAAQPFENPVSADTPPASEGWLNGINEQSDRIERGLTFLGALVEALEQVS